MTPALRDLVNKVKGDGYLSPGDCDGALADLVGAIVDYGNHEARSLVLLLQVFAEIQRRAKPEALALMIDACIQFAFQKSRDGRAALSHYLDSLDEK